MVTHVHVEKGIPVPAKKRGGIAPTLRDMAVGDSFVIPTHRAKNIYQLARYAGVKVAVRQISDDEFRVWKVA